MGKGIRLIGRIILIFGVVLLVISQVMETTVAPDYANIDTEVAINLPEKVPNIELIANKINLTLLGGFLIVIGLQLLLVSNNTISEIKEQFKK
ncbi:hypothetical protein [Flavobacterium sp.]|uniref:hypothetical protein n=1 Tax=Flavobacterium sp. TaxID=239 RepID=UPI0037878D15